MQVVTQSIWGGLTKRWAPFGEHAQGGYSHTNRVGGPHVYPPLGGLGGSERPPFCGKCATKGDPPTGEKETVQN